MSSRSSLDERAAAPMEASRKGAHRARPRTIPSLLPVLAGAAVMVLVVGGSFAVLRGGGEVDTTTEVAGAAEPSATIPAKASATKAAPKAAPEPRTAAPSVAPAAPVASPTRRAPAVDRSVDLVVLNSVSVQGLAARAKSGLEAEGWSVGRTDNSRERNLVTTKVYYGPAALAATATQVVADLQFGAIVQNSTVADSSTIVIVLGQDAT